MKNSFNSLCNLMMSPPIFKHLEEADDNDDDDDDGGGGDDDDDDDDDDEAGRKGTSSNVLQELAWIHSFNKSCTRSCSNPFLTL